MREFRKNLADYLESGRPPAIIRHGETLGFFIPAQKRSRKAEVEAMRAAATELDAMIATWGASEDELTQEYKEIRRTSRGTTRNGKQSSSAPYPVSAFDASLNHTRRAFSLSFRKNCVLGSGELLAEPVVKRGGDPAKAGSSETISARALKTHRLLRVWGRDLDIQQYRHVPG